jgi:hypothetical protein
LTPPHRVGDHRDRLGQAHVTNATGLDAFTERRHREPRADLLLERQAANARVLDAVDLDRGDAFADGGQGDRQGVHREAWIHAGTEDGHPTAPSRRIDAAGRSPVRGDRVRQFLGGRDDRHLLLQHRFELRHDLGECGTGAQHGDIRPGRADGGRNVSADLHPQTPAGLADDAEITARLLRIDVDRSDETERPTCGELPYDSRSDGT